MSYQITTIVCQICNKEVTGSTPIHAQSLLRLHVKNKHCQLDPKQLEEQLRKARGEQQ